MPLLFHTEPEASPVEEVGGMKLVAVAVVDTTPTQAVPDQIFNALVVVSSHISPTERVVHPAKTG